MAPLADSEPESVAVAAYMFFQALEEDPTSKALLLPGSTSVEMLVVEPAPSVRLELALEGARSTVAEIWQSGGCCWRTRWRRWWRARWSRARAGALSVAPLAEREPESVAVAGVEVLPGVGGGSDVEGVVAAGQDVGGEAPAPRVRLELALRVPSTVPEYRVATLLLLEAMEPVV